MRRTMLVALREFKSVVLTPVFLVGMLMMPVLAGIAGGAILLLKNQTGPRTTGAVAVVDMTGRVAPFITRQFAPEAAKAEQEAMAVKAEKMVDEQAGKFGVPKEQLAQTKGVMRAQMDEAAKADLSVTILPDDADTEMVKQELAGAEIRAPGDEQGAQRPTVALAPTAAERSG